jgi:hypothetical protein
MKAFLRATSAIGVTGALLSGSLVTATAASAESDVGSTDRAAQYVETQGLNFRIGLRGEGDRTRVIQMHDLGYRSYPTFSQAWFAEQTTYRVPAVGSTFNIIRLKNGFADQCLSHANGSGNGSRIAWVDCAASSDQQWKRRDSLRLEAVGTGKYLHFTVDQTPTNAWYLSSDEIDSAPLMTADQNIGGHAFGDGGLLRYTVDHDARSVTFPEWYSLLWGMKLNGVEVPVEESGRVAAGFTLTGLQPGLNRIPIEGALIRGGEVFYRDHLDVTVNPTLSAAVTSTDVERGTAVLDGGSPAGTDRVKVEWTTTTGEQRSEFRDVDDGTGDWSSTLTDLPVGTTSVHLSALDGATTTAEADVDVTLDVAELTASAALPEDRTENAVVSGTGQKGARITVTHGGATVGSTTADANDGSWSVEVPGPGTGGNYDVDIAQTIRNGSVEAGATSTTIHYGDAVSISDPEDGDTVEAGEPAIIQGSGEKGAPLRVFEDGHPETELAAGTVDGDDGSYRLETSALEAREYVLVVEQLGRGNNRTTAEVTINPGQPSIVSPTAEVVFDQDVEKPAVVQGTGAETARITVKNGNETLGTQIVQNGTWELPIKPLGPGTHTLTIEQTGIEGTQTTTVTVDFGAAVSLDGPSVFTNGTMTVTGTASQGAQVSITTGGKTVDTFTVDNAAGTFTRTLNGLGSGAIELTATAKSKGGLTTTDTLAAESPITPESVQIESHAKDGTFVPGPQLFTGRGTPGATITLNVHGFSAANADFDQTTTVDQFGAWQIQRNLADTTYPLFSVKQTPQNGVVNQLTNWNLRPYREIGAPSDLQLTNFADGDFFVPGEQTFTGTATPGATVRFNPFGFDDPTLSGHDIVTTADPRTGQWTIRRRLSNVLYDRIAIRQEPAADGRVNQIDGIALAPTGWLGAPADLTVTSPVADSTASAGVQTFAGSARPGTTVTVYVWGDDPTHPVSTVANARGKWRIDRPMTASPVKYNVRVVQDDAAGKVDTVRVPLTITQ